MSATQARNMPDPGSVLLEAGHAELAIPYFMELAKKEPHRWEHYSNLGIAYRILNDPERAKHYLKSALLKKVDAAPAWVNLSNVLMDLGQFDEALDCCRAAHNILPGNQIVCFNLACALLREGRWQEAWPGWEIGRYHRSWFEIPELKVWRGEDLKDKKIVVTMEGGYGDSFLFFRFLPDLQGKGAHVTFYVWDKQASMFENHPWADRVISESQGIDPREFDFQVALMSIPALLNLSSSAIPSATRYLEGTVDVGPRPTNGIRGVGLCWSAEENGSLKLSRSLIAEDLELLKDCPVHWVSLQPGEHPEWMAGEEFPDWKATAALIEKLDLVISVDTAVCHLAGAMGKPTWTIVPCCSDWKWGRHSSGTPWYPSMKIFRSMFPNSFRGVIREVVAELNSGIC